MKNLYNIIRVLFGLVLVVFGLNGFLMFIPGGPQFNEPGMAYMAALISTGYMFQVIWLLFILAGISFVTNRYVPLFAVLLAPIVFNILLFHLFLDMTGFPIALILILPILYLLWANLDRYKPMLRAK